MEDWEKELIGVVEELKDMERENRPPPKPKTETDLKSNFRGIITLRTTGEARELSLTIQRVVRKSVEFFYVIDKEDGSRQDLINDLNKMIGLCETFPPICLDKQDATLAQQCVISMDESLKTLHVEFNNYIPRAKLTPETGRRIASELRNILTRLVEVAKLMEIQQGRLITAQVEKTKQITDVLAKTNHPVDYDKKQRLFLMHIDALINLCENRINCLEGLQDPHDHKRRLRSIVNDLHLRREPLPAATAEAVNNPSSQNIERQKLESQTLQQRLDEVNAIANEITPEASAIFDHNVTINKSLDDLKQAVLSGRDNDAAKAAQRIEDELKRINANPVPGVPADDDEEARRRAREALEDAAERLRKKIRDLLGATNAQHGKQPTTEKAKTAVDRLIDDMKQETRRVRDFETVNTNLKQSGMLEAAASAAAKLATLFQE